MKHPFKFYALILSIVCLSVFAVSCSKDSDDSGDPAPLVKSLNKTTLTPKKWYSQGSVFIHDLKAGGVYGSNGGTWKWKNNSDTLEIVTQSGYQETFWKVYWNNDTEMECEKVGTFTKLMYKTVAW